MASSLDGRTKQLNTYAASSGNSVLYVMSRDQRAHDNHALLAAQAEALQRKLPLAVIFCLYPGSGYRSREQYGFMLAGLARTEAELKAYGIPLICIIGDPKNVIPTVANRFEAAAVYLDFNPLRGPRAVADYLSETLTVPVHMVDTHNIVPCWLASDKQEVGARTLRPKLHRLLPEYLAEPPRLQRHLHEWPGTYMDLAGLEAHINAALQDVPSSGVSYNFPDPHTGLSDFLERALEYETGRNEPVLNGQSQLSPYLHFGQLSSLRVVLELVQRFPSGQVSSFIEQVFVRKELGDNFCCYNPWYDSLAGAPAWAQASLAKHAEDPREFMYTLEQLEAAQTHDPAWNAAQMQMVRTGKMHGYMRMYWAKKVLEWSPPLPRPENLAPRHPFREKLESALSQKAGAEWAIAALLYLNDFYSVDGRDPNGYTGILWSVGGVHDRPWFERPVYGVIRYMNYNGLTRKFNIAEYENMFN